MAEGEREQHNKAMLTWRRQQEEVKAKLCARAPPGGDAVPAQVEPLCALR